MKAVAFLAATALAKVSVDKRLHTEAEYWTNWNYFLDEVVEGIERFADKAEHDARFEIFKDNMDTMKVHNDADHSWKMGITPFVDMTQDEFVDFLKRNALQKPEKTGERELYDASKYPEAADSKDWVDAGAVTPVKNQGSCGSCWAFSTTGGIEGQYFLKNNILSSFSEQQLVDCSQAEGNQGCNGGLMDDGFKYVESKGLCLESAYSYEGTDGTCRDSKCTATAHVSSYTDIDAGSTSDLLSASSNIGPISIAVDANMFWQFYSSGIFDHTCNPDKLDHGVLLVGYQSGSYWKVKNSWGETWGESGYIRLKGTDDNTCGLANSASYPKM